MGSAVSDNEVYTLVVPYAPLVSGAFDALLFSVQPHSELSCPRRFRLHHDKQSFEDIPQ